MAQTPQKRGPEPWLKPQKKGFLSHGSEGFPSHGSNPQKMGSRAMAQTQLCTAHFNLEIFKNYDEDSQMSSTCGQFEPFCSH